MDDYSVMVFDYKNYENRQDMYKDIMKLLDILATNDYVAVCRYDGVGNYVVEFNPDNYALAGSRPMWLDEGEYEAIIDGRNKAEVII